MAYCLEGDRLRVKLHSLHVNEDVPTFFRKGFVFLHPTTVGMGREVFLGGSGLLLFWGVGGGDADQ